MNTKFRGKRKDNGEWVYGYYAVEDGKHGILTNPKDGNPRLLWVDVIPSTVGMWTGEKDKNGKDVYEGDRCQYSFTAKSYHPLTVSDRKETFYVEDIRNMYFPMGDHRWSEGVEVIEAIHDKESPDALA